MTFSIETLPGLSERTVQILETIEAISVVIFTAEYILRCFVADKTLRFVFSFYGIIDLLAVLPFYFSTGIDLRTMRIFRLLRLFRAFKLLRYNKAIRRFHIALTIAKEELILFSGLTAIVLYLSSVGIYLFEHKAQPEVFTSVFSSMWWSVATLTTVGYGDVYPVTVGGRIFTFAVLMAGLGVVAIPTGLLASALSKAREVEAT